MAGSSDVHVELIAETFNDYDKFHVNCDFTVIDFNVDVHDYCSENQLSNVT